MKNLDRIFKNFGSVELLTESGETFTGSGSVSPLRRDLTGIGNSRHRSGEFSRPLWHFVGTFPASAKLAGGTLKKSGRSFQVLSVRPLILGDSTVCLRALLERGE